MNDKDLKAIQEKLYNMELDLPEDDWQAISSRLPKKRRILPIWMRYAAAAIFVFACFSTVLLFIQKENNITDVTFATTQIKSIQHQKRQEIKHEISTRQKEIHAKVKSSIIIKETQKETVPQGIEEKAHSLRASTTQTFDEELKTQPITPKLLSYSLINPSPTHLMINQQEYKGSLSIDEAENLMRRIHNSTIITDYVPELNYDNQKTRPEKWNLNLLANITTDSKSNLYHSNVNTLSKPPDYMMTAPQAKEKKTHDLPISFAVGVGKQIVKGLYLKTGIQYTNLHSEYHTSMQYSEEYCDQYLQYIGIPLEVSYHFIEKKYFYTYLGANVMIEKGISQYKKKYSVDTDGKRLDLSNSYNNELKGFQWSLGLNCGMGFNITKNIGIFAQPSINWYLENNLYPQPESIRTINPYTFNIVAGLRINLN